MEEFARVLSGYELGHILRLVSTFGRQSNTPCMNNRTYIILVQVCVPSLRVLFTIVTSLLTEKLAV